MLLRCIPVLLFTLALSAQDGAVKVREDQLTLPTYDEGAPSANPQFDAFFRNPFPNYPYTIRTPVNRIRHMAQWRVVILENEYLSCRVLPDLGGHLQGCTDRITGKEIFYSNPAVRRTGESVRGAFIATGIESSFPFAHSRVAASPVDYAWSLRDGVGRVVVEDTDRSSGMEWRDEFILRPHSTVLEQRVTLYNGSAARRGYHWWVNAAVELDDPHLRVVYPVKWMLPHGDGPMTSWPLGDFGEDLGDAANHKEAVGLFAHASHEPWMAIYKPQFRSGVAHFADPDQVKGKKIWLWGSSDGYVRQVLTENFNSYVEMQAGEFETQPEFGFLRPAETKSFTHYWIPFRDLGGVSRATRDVVLNVGRDGQKVVVELSVTHPMAGAKIRLSDGAKTLSEIPADLDPKVSYAKALNDAPAKLTVDVLDAAGTVLLHHVEDEYDAQPFDKTAKNPEPVPPADSSDSEAAALERGSYNEQRDLWFFAWSDYEAGLRKSPGSAKLAAAAGRAAVVLNRYDDAIRLLARVAGANAEAAYYYGTALASTSQHVSEARTALTNAAKDPLYAAAARLQLALLAARESKDSGMAEALRTLQDLAAAQGAPARVGALEVALLRRTGRADEAKKRLAFWLEQDPADDMLRVERSFSDNADDASLWNHFAADPERLLNVAEEYRQLGACDDALKILDRPYAAVPATETEPGTALPQENPLVVYYRGYCRLQTGKDPKPDFAAAAKLSTLYIFPHREIDFRILQAAIGQNESDAVAHALLGDLYFASLETDKAIAEWRKALALKRDLPAIHRNLGRALLDIKNDPVGATPVLLEGRRLNPDDVETADAWNRLNIPGTPDSLRAKPAVPDLNNVPSPKISGAESAKGDVTKSDIATGDLAGRALIRSAIEAGAAAALFTAQNFPKDKQPEAVRQAYIEVQLQRLLEQAYAGDCRDALPGLETLGDEDRGLPFTLYGFGTFMKRAHFQYYMGLVENVCGAGAAAKKRWSKISKHNEPIDSPDYIYPYLAAKNLGDSDASRRIEAAIQTLKDAGPEDSRPALTFARGALLMVAGNRGEGDALLQKSLHTTDSFVQYLSLAMLAESSRK